MIRAVAGLELRHALRQPVFWLISLAYFGFALAYISTEIVGGTLASAAVDVNSSWAITRMVTHLSYLGLVGTAAFVGHSVIRDFRGGMAELLFTTRMTRRDYVLGRFLGGTLAAAIAFSAVFAGLALGHLVPWADPQRLGHFQMTGFMAAYAVFAVTNAVIGACILFSLALVTRDPLKTWTGAVAVLVAFFISRAFAGAFYTTEQGQALAALVEPFGAYAATAVALDWTPHDRNELVLGHQALILWNRALWMALGAGAVALAYAVFRRQPIQTVAGSRGRRSRKRRQRRVPRSGSTSGFQPMSAFAQWWALTLFELRRILHGAPFRVMLGLSLVALWIWVSQYGRAYGTGFHPYTADMAQHIHTVFRVPLIAIMTFYAAELTWGAHLNRFAPIIDATPVRNSRLLLSRFVALVGAVLAVLAAGVLVTLAHQLSRGFTAIEPGIYLVHVLLYSLPYFAVMAAFALLLQVLAGNRYAGMLAMAVLFLGTEVAGTLGIDSNLLIPGARLSLHYTPLAGFGHYLEPVAWFHAYWLALAGLAVIVATAFFPRGERGGPWRARPRLAMSLAQWRVSVVLLGAVLGMGGWIFWNTQVLDPIPSESESNRRAASYEREYGAWRDARRPRVSAATGELELHPQTRHFRFSGRLTLVNPWDQPLESVLLTAPEGASFTEAGFAGVEEPHGRHDPGTGTIEFNTRIEPGQSRTLKVSLRSLPIEGFRNRPERTPVTHNGSLLFHDRFLPTPGYDAGREVSDAGEREDLGLPERTSNRREHGDPRGRREPLGAPHGGWLDLSLTVGAPENQTVVAPGRLIERVSAGDRARYRFRTDTPIPPSFAVAAGSYHRTERVVAGRKGPVRLSVHAMPGHGRNVEALLDTMARTLAALERRLGHYPYRRMRLVEVDLGEPNCRIRADTVYCDRSLGFINDPRLDEPRRPSNSLVKIPAAMLTNLYLRSVLLPANQPGASSLTDGPGFYLSQLVWAAEAEQNVETAAVRDLHWHYFTQRSQATEEGTIVAHPEQTWIGAHKHAAVLYGLERYIGRDTVVDALAGLIDRYRLAEPPLPHTRDLVDALKDRTSKRWQPLVSDLFERRTLYDLSLTSARATRARAGGYRIEVLAEADKRFLDAMGDSQSAELSIPLELVVFGSPNEKSADAVLWSGMVPAEDLNSGRVRITVEELPETVSIDPYRRLLDPDRTDNRIEIQ
ncbi:MAG: hypothetical protein FKY71_11125 [Spiribacter salinus]|uniref:Uncharacterized protein n=1 Tax=Spiribacter salinus TaxID=1335746 RepID=A0A540VS16_9GAMM|nr:MAG: hypothetical protein FKY71_11125 [Spiribacter salinus]